jgi:hypothetical protein
MATEEQREILPEESGGDASVEDLMDKLGVDDIEEALEKVDSVS